MKRYAIAAVLMLVFSTVSGCYDPNRQKLVGTWQVNLEMTEADLRNMSAFENPVVAAMGRTLMKAMQVAVELDLQQDGTLKTAVSMLGNTVTRTGTWRYVGSEGEAVTVSSQLEGDRKSQEWTIQFQGDDAFQTTPPIDGQLQINRLVTFRRAADK